MRNIPLLLQLFFWYGLITESLPGPRQAAHPLPGVFLSNRGLVLPGLRGGGVDWLLAGLACAIVGVVLLGHWARRRQNATGRIFPLGRVGLAVLVCGPVAGWLIGGAPLALDVPYLKGFNFSGGITLTPEFTALLTGLVIYTSAFVAEVVRSGIRSEERRVGKECVSTCRSRGSQLQLKKKKQKK